VAQRFAFYGRVSTEDNQDPAASRRWQLDRARALVEKHGGLVAEYFDIGQSRSIPWKRRPEAARLLAALKDGPDFDAIVIGEPQRAFYGNQFGLTFPVLVHYGITLWVPEVGGPIDPESEAHDLIMSVFGGMSKGERTRIRIRVRAAMRSQAEIEGRFLGGRPPYGYRLRDSGAHPHPGKAAEGRRLHVLEPHPETAPVVRRIFTEYLAGAGIFSIAEGLTREGVLSPSAHDPGRNRHRSGTAWSKSAVRVILTNPRYTGHQVWNKQRKDETLIDVEDVALGHTSTLRWNDRDEWVWSETAAHTALVDRATFDTAQTVMAGHGRGKVRDRRRVRRPYVLRGLVHCGVCDRRMQGQWNHDRAYYRCRYPREYALANTVEHPPNVYVAEHEVLAPLDSWLAGLFAPDRLADTLRCLHDAQDDRPDPAAAAAGRIIAECDAKLARYRSALEAGADPAVVAGWIAETQAARAAAAGPSRPARPANRRMTEQEIASLVDALGGIASVLKAADPADKAEVYKRLGLTLRFDPESRVARAEVLITSTPWGYGACPRGDSTT
jgi:site-specific DNA recombinase